MRKQFNPAFIVGVLLFLASCSSPRYTYNFDYYDYNSGRKKLESPHPFESGSEVGQELLKIERNDLVASTDPDLSEISDVSSIRREHPESSAKSIKDLSATERKHLRKELKSYIKNHSKELKSGSEVASVNATKQLDDDLKLAIIFGAIGITFAILGGINTVFWVIGVIGLIVGLVFFIRWISTQ